MQSRDAVSALRSFLKEVGDLHVESTSAQLTNYAGVLYNVIGSTSDPKIDGQAWKQLLIGYGVNGNCYVTNSGAEGTHPAFSVGGHMTTNSDGSVVVGGTCYLMPLCYFHNGKGQNGVAFDHAQTSMLLLSGYMQSDLAATFVARMPDPAPYSLVYLSEKGIESQNVSKNAIADLTALSLPNANPGRLPDNHILFRREQLDDRTVYVVERASLPG